VLGRGTLGARRILLILLANWRRRAGFYGLGAAASAATAGGRAAQGPVNNSAGFGLLAKMPDPRSL
jgi:hypothetical protein